MTSLPDPRLSAVLSTLADLAASSPRSRHADRDASILALLRQGFTYAAIGDRYGISRQRVKQIALRHGITSKQARAVLRDRLLNT